MTQYAENYEYWTGPRFFKL